MKHSSYGWKSSLNFFTFSTVKLQRCIDSTLELIIELNSGPKQHLCDDQFRMIDHNT